MDAIENIINSFNGLLWGWPMIIMLLGTHIFLTFRLRIIQRYIFKAIKLSFKKDGGKGDISPFGALVTSLAATIGTGNILGVATAIALGGPGALFWCWIVGIFGISTKYAECLLSILYRKKNSRGEMVGGPMVVIERGLKMRWLGILFALFTTISAFGIGNMVQANAITQFVGEQLSLSDATIGIALAAMVALVLISGVKGIAKICSMIVPFMALIYVVLCVVILVINSEYLSQAISLILSEAFSSRAAGGGIVGAGMIVAIRYGVARGLFSNEAGLGSAPIIAAAARSKNPIHQALIASTAPFWDTVVVCALTGLVIVTSIIAYPDIDSSDGALLTYLSFSKVPFGDILLTVGLFFFAFSTILGWSYYGEKAIEYLGGLRFVLFYRIIWVVGIFVGSVLKLSIVWSLSDIMNAMMALPNVISLLLLSGVVVRTTDKYLWRTGGKNLF